MTTPMTGSGDAAPAHAGGGTGAEPMSPERWARVEALFAEAVERTGGGRARFLTEACGSDATLRREVESLLLEHDEDPGFLETPVPPDRTPAGAPPASIGPYRILRALGQGGMGQVWLAERQTPDFRQLVALKLLRRGLDTADLITRFRAERRILARLNHPNIARLHDVGATDDGLPFFAMEYVDGVPILEYCDGRALGVAERLDLFRAICAAVQHAHSALVVHRDIKPGNVLVGSDGAVKLLDFGIAKVLRGEDDDADARLTKDGSLLNTPRYAAPEQVRGEPVTTACDVYALGILLYELLAGRHPFEGGPGARPDLDRAAPEMEPPPPSRALAGPDAEAAASARGTTPAHLRGALRGDLDSIALQALRREPADRYATASGLAEDVERHLAGLPIRARPQTLPYRARKFVARHRLPVAAASVFVLVLVAATGITLRQSGLVREQAALVARERDKAFEVRSFLLEMFGATGPDQATGDSVTARQLLDRRAAMVPRAYADDPDTRAEMLTVLAEGYERLGLYDAAEPLAREGLAIRRARFGAVHPDLAVSLDVLGWLRRQRGDLVEADRLLRESVEVGRLAFPPEGDARLARALNDLGVVRVGAGAATDAEPLLRESLAMRRRLLGPEDLGVAITSSNLAVVLAQGGALAEAVPLLDSARAAFERIVGPDHQRSLTALFNLASLTSQAGDHVTATALHRELLARRIRLLGPRHPQVAESMVSVANELRAEPALDEAAALLDSALAIQLEALGPGHPEIAETLQVRGHVLASSGRHGEAVADYGRAMAILGSAGAEQSFSMVVLRSLEARSREALGEDAAAEAALRDAARRAEATYGPAHAATLGYRLDLVEHLLRRGARDAAAVELRPVEVAVEEDGAGTEAVRARVAAARERIDQ